jgi:Flp pilus assembly protein TadD
VAEAPTPAHLGDPTLDQALALDRANAAFKQGDVPTAVRALEEVVAGPPSAARTSALMSLANTLEATDPAAAGRWYVRLLAEAPDVPEAHFAAGRFRAVQDDVKGAMAAFREALRLQGDLLPVYPLLGALLVQTGAKDEAAQLFLTYERRLEALSKRVKASATPLGEKLPVIELFGLVDDERSQAVLTELLKDPLPEVRVASASALAQSGEPEHLVTISEAAVAERDGVARQLLTQILMQFRSRVAEAPP